MSTLAAASYIAELFTNVVALCEKYPDAVYAPNSKVEDYDDGFVECGPPEQGCLIGQANRMLKGHQRIRLIEGLNIAGCINMEFGSNFNKNPETINMMNMLATMQKLQDKRTPWGTCLMMVR